MNKFRKFYLIWQIKVVSFFGKQTMALDIGGVKGL